MTFLIALFTVFLLMISTLMILIILMQKAKTDGGMGAALGGGAAESAFGAETNTVLRKGTIYCAVVFFVLSFGIYLAHQHQRYQAGVPARGLDEISPPEEAGEGPVSLDDADGLIDEETLPAEPVEGDGGDAMTIPLPAETEEAGADSDADDGED